MSTMRDLSSPAVRIKPVSKKTLPVVFLIFLLFNPSRTYADELYLNDGSRIAGDVITMQDGIYVIETGFAGTLEVAAELVKGITLENRALVTLSNGERFSGRLFYSPEDGQTLSGTTFGDTSLSDDLSVVAISDAGGVAESRDSEIQEQRQEKEIAVLEQRKPHGDLWAGDIAIGVNGSSGNTDRFGLHVRAEARRATNGDRLTLYTEGDLQRQNGVTTAEEILTGASLERDFARDWFVYGSADFEKDKFEDLELRTLVNAGVGYFLVRDEDIIWKALAGMGYQYESFENNEVEEEGLVSLGYDLRYAYNSWIEIVHKLTYFPSLRSPTGDYRLMSNLGMQMPIGNTRNWNLRLSLRNQYDSTPRPGIEELDTSYTLNLVYDWE